MTDPEKPEAPGEGVGSPRASSSDEHLEHTASETVCPGWASNRCATCDCWLQPKPPKQLVAHRGALFDGTYRGNRLPAWMNPHPDDVRELQRQRDIRMAKRQMRWATEGPTEMGDKRRRALGVLKWAETKRWAHIPVGLRDTQISYAIYYLGALVNEGWLTRDEVLDTILVISDACGHSRDNKSHKGIEADVDRGLAAAARDGIAFDWESFHE